MFAGSKRSLVVRLNILLIISSKVVLSYALEMDRNSEMLHTTKHDASPIECKIWFIVDVLLDVNTLYVCPCFVMRRSSSWTVVMGFVINNKARFSVEDAPIFM